MGDNWIIVIVAILGSSFLSSVVTNIFTNKKNKAESSKISVEANKVFQELWHEELDRLKENITELKISIKQLELDKCNREAAIKLMNEENKQLRSDLEELKMKYDGQIRENKTLRAKILTLTRENEELAARITRLEGME